MLASAQYSLSLSNLPDIILLSQAKESSDLGGSLGTKSLWIDNVGEPWNVLLALLDNGQSKNRQILTNDASSDRLPLSLTRSSWSVAGVAIGEKESNSSWEHLRQVSAKYSSLALSRRE